MTVQPFAYAWRWKGGITWRLTFNKNPNAHPDIEIKELFEYRSAPSDGLREAAQRAVDEWAEHLEDGDAVPSWVAPLSVALTENGGAA